MTQEHDIPKNQHHVELDPLSQRLRQHLDASLDDLDQGTLERLASARQAALSSARDNKRPWTDVVVAADSNWLLPVGALASIVLMLVTLGVLINSSSSLLPTTALDIELLSSSEQLDTYDNLEFYRWLALNEQAS